jgi:SAM-dependent methyltransferase
VPGKWMGPDPPARTPCQVGIGLMARDLEPDPAARNSLAGKASTRFAWDMTTMMVFRVRGRVEACRARAALSGRGRLAAELVEQAGVGAGDLVVEIGAGSGVLTEALARRAGRVVAVECDPRLAEQARARLAGFGNVRVVTADALALPPPRRPFRVVANPPFGSTAAILRRLLGDPRTRLERADLVLQEQAARRYAAGRPSTPETIAWGAWYDLGPAAVWSRPASGRRRGSGRPCWWPAAGGRRWSRWPGTAASPPWSGPPSAIPGCRCAAAWSRRSPTDSCAGWPATSASPSTPARPTWTPSSGPACTHSSPAADLGRRDESP